MPGVIPHLIASSILFVIGKYHFRNYFEGDHKTKEQLLLAGVCIFFSIIPDFFLGIYYTTHLLPYRTLLDYHQFTHLVLSPIAIGALILLIYRVDIKRKPIWIMGVWSISLHLAMDFFVHLFNIPYSIFL
jgi:hypothetical protein